MAIPKIDKLSLAELQSLKKMVDKAIGQFEVRKRKEALAAIEAKAKEMGFSLNELTGKQKAAAKAPASAPKYRHPDNASVTWSGRGRQPGWIKEGLASGKSLEDFAI